MKIKSMVFAAWFAACLFPAILFAQCQDPVGILTLSTTSLDFGQVTVGETASRTFRIENGSTYSDLLVTAVLSNNPQFQVTGFSEETCLPYVMVPAKQPQAQIANEILITVVFVPTQVGVATGTITVESSDVEAANTVALHGGAIAGGMLQVRPGVIDFGSVPVGGQAQNGFTIANVGGGSLTISGVASSSSPFFVVSPRFPRTFQPGQRVLVVIGFAPPRPGHYSGSFSIAGVDSQILATVGVIGSALQGNPGIRLSKMSLDFGTGDVGTFKSRRFQISNVGNVPLQITFRPPADVMVSPPSPLSIDAGRAVGVRVDFIFTQEGENTRSLSVASNDTAHPLSTVALMGLGEKAKLGFLNKTSSSHIGRNPVRSNGVQWVDYNVDGRLDLYFCGPGGNRLFKNMGNNVLANVTKAAGLADMHDCAGASWADIDHDGDCDLFIANSNAPSVICTNNKGKFACSSAPLVAASLHSAATGVESSGGIWFDFNRDGLLDLFIVQDGKPNQLLKNDGLLRFHDVAESAHVALTAAGRGAVAADFNNDGYIDLYVVNDGSPNRLYINNHNETFRDVSHSANVAFVGDSRQVTVSDYNGDGRTDILVVNGDGPSILYRNMGHLKFQNATQIAGLSGPRNATSASFSDYDNDGDEDLILLTLGGNYLYKNSAGKFSKVGNVDLSNAGSPTGAGTGDINGDGQQDVVIADGANGNSLYENTGGEGSNWLTLILHGTQSNFSAIGARVLLRVGVTVQSKVVSAGNGQNQDSLPLEFGLGTATLVNQIVINWPSGRIQVVNNVAANQKLVVTEE
jgi:hypothetical protein